MKKILILLFSIIVFCANAQIRNNDVYEITEMDKSNVRKEIRIPGFSGYYTLKCDFHIHTIFSDGEVWPTVRVNEAWQQGLDAIAITDHIEYRPSKETLKGDLNESYKIAKKQADNIGFIVIPGTEITRDKPIGHLNALFVSDVSPIETEDPLNAIDAALKQGAFIMWNHPGWPDDKSTLYPVHEQLIKEKKIHGIEVFNYMEYYPVSFDWCKKMNLSFLSNSDVHGLITQDYGNGIRPLTLVFATERSEKGIKEAMFNGRTAAYFHGQLAGKPEHLLELLNASLEIKIINPEKNLAEIHNKSDIDYKISCNNGLYIFPANKTVRVVIPKGYKATVLNCYTGMNEYLEFIVPQF